MMWLVKAPKFHQLLFPLPFFLQRNALVNQETHAMKTLVFSANFVQFAVQINQWFHQKSTSPWMIFVFRMTSCHQLSIQREESFISLRKISSRNSKWILNNLKIFHRKIWETSSELLCLILTSTRLIIEIHSYLIIIIWYFFIIS